MEEYYGWKEQGTWLNYRKVAFKLKSGEQFKKMCIYIYVIKLVHIKPFFKKSLGWQKAEHF